MIGVPPSTHHLKAKLEGLRKIFDEDDTAQLRMQQGHFQNVPTLANSTEFDIDRKLVGNNV
jgi:hypothetical protein